MKPIVFVLALLACGAMLATGSVRAQPYPGKPIRLVTSEAGGGNDVQARLIAQGVSSRIRQRIVVDNRPSGVIPGEIVSKAAPDGYTLLFYNNTLWIASLMQKTPYKGAAQGLNDVVGGRVQVMFPTSVAATPFVRSGKVRALAVTSAEPSALAPGLPTVAAAGLPGYESIAIYGVFAPAKTPRAIIRTLNEEITRVLTAAEFREKFFNIGMDPVGGSPEQLTAMMKSEIQRLAKVIKDSRIHVE
jgi:tripartite-type tricarboxylate transporter receptor subunit TctC